MSLLFSKEKLNTPTKQMAIRMNDSNSYCEHSVIILDLHCHYMVNTCPGSVICIHKACYLGIKDLTVLILGLYANCR